MLTQRQHQLLHFIHRYLAVHGVPPSFEEMRDALKLRSKSGIHRLITGLEERGYIRRLAYRARALEVLRLPQAWSRGAPAASPEAAADLGDGESNVVRGPFGGASGVARVRPAVAGEGAGDEASGAAVAVPLLGRIAAGSPIEALRDATETIEVPSFLLRGGDHYALEVVGDSMVEAGIFDGDTAVVQQTDTTENGQVVVALIDDHEVTLKRLRRKGDSIALEPANPSYETRIFGPNRVKLQGRLVGLIRRY